jgi:hypothetical protein
MVTAGPVHSPLDNALHRQLEKARVAGCTQEGHAAIAEVFQILADKVDGIAEETAALVVAKIGGSGSATRARTVADLIATMPPMMQRLYLLRWPAALVLCVGVLSPTVGPSIAKLLDRHGDRVVTVTTTTASMDTQPDATSGATP